MLDKYLKSRKERELSLDDTHHVMHVINVLDFTIYQMQAINDVWKP